jgi:hypothetical protein
MDLGLMILLILKGMTEGVMDPVEMSRVNELLVRLKRGRP